MSCLNVGAGANIHLSNCAFIENTQPVISTRHVHSWGNASSYVTMSNCIVRDNVQSEVSLPAINLRNADDWSVHLEMYGCTLTGNGPDPEGGIWIGKNQSLRLLGENRISGHATGSQDASVYPVNRHTNGVLTNSDPDTNWIVVDERSTTRDEDRVAPARISSRVSGEQSE